MLIRTLAHAADAVAPAPTVSHQAALRKHLRHAAVVPSLMGAAESELLAMVMGQEQLRCWCACRWWRLRSASTLSGSEGPSWPRCPPSSRCGSQRASTTSPAHPSCTASASRRPALEASGMHARMWQALCRAALAIGRKTSRMGRGGCLRSGVSLCELCQPISCMWGVIVVVGSP